MDLPKLLKPPKISFWLRSAKKGYYLICELNLETHEARFSTGIKLSKRGEWNEKKGVLTDAEKEQLRIKIINDLNRIANNLILQEKSPIPSVVLDIYNKKGKTPSLMEVYQLFVNERIKPKYERGEMGKDTYNKYAIYRPNTLRTVLSAKGKSNITIVEANNTDLLQNLEAEIGKDKVGKTTKRYTNLLTDVLEFAEIKGFINRNVANSQTFLVKAKSKEKIIYLVENQIESIENLTLIEPTLDIARDIFLVMCYTGMIHKDLTLFDMSEDVFDDLCGIKRISSKRIKTGSDFCVPLLPQVEKIMAKYGNKLPYVKNDHLNTRIRKIANYLNINIHLTTYIGRKTFGYLMLNVHRLPIEIVSKMMGHKSVNMTLKFYARHLDRTIIEATKHLVIQPKYNANTGN